jgi:hypothetical protein
MPALRRKTLSGPIRYVRPTAKSQPFNEQPPPTVKHPALTPPPTYKARPLRARIARIFGR